MLFSGKFVNVLFQYADDLMMLAKLNRAICDDERLMRNYLGLKENGHAQLK